MTVEPTGEVIINTCSVQTDRCIAITAAPITIVTTAIHERIKVCGPCLEEKIRDGDWEIQGAKIKRKLDIAVYSATNKLVLIIEVKKKPRDVVDGPTWASRVRRNLLTHSSIPFTQYFMLAVPPNTVYLWKHFPDFESQESPNSDTSPIFQIEQLNTLSYVAPDQVFEASKLPGWPRRSDRYNASLMKEADFRDDVANWIASLTQGMETASTGHFIRNSDLLAVLKGGTVVKDASIPKRPYGEVSALTVLQILCDASLANLPETAKDKKTQIELRRALALGQLLKTIQRYTGSQRLRLDVPDGYTPAQSLEFQIYRFLEHEWSLYGDGKKSIIMTYVDKALKQ